MRIYQQKNSDAEWNKRNTQERKREEEKLMIDRRIINKWANKYINKQISK